MRLLCWNVNGLRAAVRKGFLEWLVEEQPDIMCVQETKAQEAQLSDAIRNVEGYHSYFASAERKGYSGVAVYSRENPLEVDDAVGDPILDAEGRLLRIRYPAFTLYNIYFPNGKASQERLDYKMDFYERFLAYIQREVDAGEEIIVCGDVNTAHREIDLARPKENETISGFLPEERAWIDRFLALGFSDSFRVFTPEAGHYTWWDLRTRARERNVGWRIDYVFVTDGLRTRLEDAFILPEVEGSDHCPIGISLGT